MTRIADSAFVSPHPNPPPQEGRGPDGSPSFHTPVLVGEGRGGGWRLVAIFAILAILPQTSQAQIPGVESFVRPATTPLDLWEVSDYLIRTGQTAQAIPFLTRFEAANPDDATLIQVREQYGQNSIMRLLDLPSTRPFGERLSKRLSEAGRRHATQPDRIAAAIALLSKSPEERNLGIERLREAGEAGVPPLIKALNAPGLSPEGRKALIRGLGALDTATVAPLIATLDSPDAATVSAAAQALGAIGDLRAVPALTILAATPNAPARDAARLAIARITGRPFDRQPKPPVRLLDDTARALFLSIPSLPNAAETAWTWDQAANAPAARPTTRAEVAAINGLKLARGAVKLAPDDRPARITMLQLAIERDPAAAISDAMAAGPVVLGDLITRSIADGRNSVAVTAIDALAKVTDAKSLNATEKAGPLTRSLYAPDRRVQFAAARALVGLDPKRSFPGSSQLVPTLARFASTGSEPRAVVIDGNANRGSQVVGFLKMLGYDAQLASTGEAGFRLAAEVADVELITIDPDLVQGSWRLLDILANLRADAKTAGIPVFLVGPLSLRDAVAPKLESFPDVKYLVTPTESVLFKRQVEHALASLRARPLSAKERADYASAAAELLGRIAANPASPFRGELGTAAPSLSIAFNTPATSKVAAKALGELATVDAQRDLADTLLNPSKPSDLRVAASNALVKNIQRFGPLMARDQERRLVTLLDSEADPAVVDALAAVAQALRPKPARAVQATRPSAAR
jgi:HEAT repeat protein